MYIYIHPYDPYVYCKIEMLYVICIHTLGFSIRGSAPSVTVISCFLKPTNYGAPPCRTTGSGVKSLAGSHSSTWGTLPRIPTT